MTRDAVRLLESVWIKPPGGGGPERVILGTSSRYLTDGRP